jgi:hypothetical protein
MTGPHPHAVPLTQDPLATERLIVDIVEKAALDHDACKELVDGLTGDQIVAMARAAHSFMPSLIEGGPRGEDAFMKLFTAALQGAATEWVTDYLVIQIQSPGMAEPRRVRIAIMPDEPRVRFAKSQPLGKRVTVKHGG